jgi:CheY-like chemotaxis protein
MATEAQPATQTKRILVVEDEVMIRMLLEDMLGELGYTVAAEAARIDEALEATKNADFDLAILDANLNGQPVSPVADASLIPLAKHSSMANAAPYCRWDQCKQQP